MPLPAFTASQSLRPSTIFDSGAQDDGESGLFPAETFYATAEWVDDAGNVRARGCGKGSTMQKALNRARDHVRRTAGRDAMVRVFQADKDAYKACMYATRLTDQNNNLHDLGL